MIQEGSRVAQHFHCRMAPGILIMSPFAGSSRAQRRTTSAYSLLGSRNQMTTDPSASAVMRILPSPLQEQDATGAFWYLEVAMSMAFLCDLLFTFNTVYFGTSFRLGSLMCTAAPQCLAGPTQKAPSPQLFLRPCLGHQSKKL